MLLLLLLYVILLAQSDFGSFLSSCFGIKRFFKRMYITANQDEVKSDKETLDETQKNGNKVKILQIESIVNARTRAK